MKALLIILALSSLPALAQDEDDILGILSITKMTGICGILHQTIQFQSSTKMEGGDEFILRFWTTEAARLGKTLEEFGAQCNESIKAYNTIWSAVAADE